MVFCPPSDSTLSEFFQILDQITAQIQSLSGGYRAVMALFEDESLR
jgi:hypothetical protein